MDYETMGFLVLIAVSIIVIICVAIAEILSMRTRIKKTAQKSTEIKPIKEWQPFSSTDELLYEYHKRGGVGDGIWLVGKDGCKYNILAMTKKAVAIEPPLEMPKMPTMWISLVDLLDNYNFLDGSTCGAEAWEVKND